MNSIQKKEPNQGMIEVASSRVAQEVQASMAIAKRFPRDEQACIDKILQACQRQSLAEQAQYVYPRGGSNVTGPSIRLAEMLAQSWGNIDFGIVELEQRDGESVMMSYAWDLETNTRQTKIFTVAHERHTRNGVTALTDPRDIYELTANQGSRRLRACILGIIPGDIQDLAVDECTKTLKSKSKESISSRIDKMLSAFKKYNVTKEHIEKRLGHNISATSEQELVNLISVFNAIKDGMSSASDHFDLEVKQETTAVAKTEANADEKPWLTLDDNLDEWTAHIGDWVVSGKTVLQGIASLKKEYQISGATQAQITTIFKELNSAQG